MSLFLYGTPASAQFLNGTNNTAPTLDIDPLYPDPSEPVTVRFADYGAGNTGSVTWTIDGTPQPEFDGQSAITITAPLLGETRIVAARTVSVTAGARSATKEITPGQVDIVVEGDTLVPYFYAGRRVPSPGSTARLIAIPHLFYSDSSRVPSTDLVYSWSINNVVAKRAVGDSAFSLTLSPLGDSLVTLVVESRDARVRFEKIFSIPTATPHLLFYPHTAHGLSHNAVRDRYFRTDTEATVRAEPYFVSRSIYGSAQHGWTLNGSPINNANADPHMITLRKGEGGGVSEIGFSVRNLSALSQYAADLFQLEFN